MKLEPGKLYRVIDNASMPYYTLLSNKVVSYAGTAPRNIALFYLARVRFKGDTYRDTYIKALWMTKIIYLHYSWKGYLEKI